MTMTVQRLTAKTLPYSLLLFGDFAKTPSSHTSSSRIIDVGVAITSSRSIAEINSTHEAKSEHLDSKEAINTQAQLSTVLLTWGEPHWPEQARFGISALLWRCKGAITNTMRNHPNYAMAKNKRAKFWEGPEENNRGVNKCCETSLVPNSYLTMLQDTGQWKESI